MSGVGLGGGGDDGFGETLVFNHSFGELHAADFTHAVFVVAPGASCEVAADDHFETETFAAVAYGDHGVGYCEFPVRHDVSGGIKE